MKTILKPQGSSRSTMLMVLLFGIGTLFTLLTVRPASTAYASVTTVVYDDALGSVWANWSWDSTINLSNTSPVHGGAHSIAVTYTAGWGALYLHADPAFDTSGYDTLRFWINGGGAGGQQLRVVAEDDTNDTFAVTPQANTWTQVNVPLSALGSPTSLTKLYWQDTTGGAQPVFYLDDIQLIGSGTPAPTPTPGFGPTLRVDANANRHAISPYIYGMNFADEDLAAELNLPVRRWGGNSTSRYNWQNDFTNTGSDWYFENIPQDSPLPSGLPNGSSSDQFVDQDRRTNTRTLLTVPLIGWVAKTSSVDHPYACGFKVSKYGAQDSTDQWDTDCGNGVHNGTDLTGNDPTDTSIPVDHTFVQGWINHLTGRYGTAANGGVLFYDLDNEPMLWNSTHRDVHPQPTSYDEMLTRTVEIAPAIKAADPSAQTLGPVGWGWCEYFFSARDGCNIGTDYTSHGNIAFVAWYLQQMRAYDQAHSQRVLDYLDLHYYPQANGVSLSPAGNAATQALRLRSTRSLWDPTYADESWIGDAGWEGGIVRLIPRMKDWVSANYTGTKTAITEYNWGGLESINGALAEADVLGIFGREGLDLATMWGPPTSTQPSAYAFRMYLNYDGTHGLFGDVSVSATSTNQDQVSVYAAQRSSDGALTLMIINKATNGLTSTLSLSNYAPRSTAQVYRYSAANLNAIVRQPDLNVTASGFTLVYPASSITLIVLTPGNTLTVNTVGSGSVIKNPDQTSYAIGTVITLTANPQVGWAFGNWSGDLVGSANPVTITMTASKIVTATFTQIPYTLTIGTVGSGSVTKNPNQSTYHYGDVVTVTAVPAASWYFAYWSGALSGILNPAPITINGSKTVTATFTQTCPAITGVDFLSTPDVLGTRRAVTFTAVISGGMLPITYTWDFGDSGHTVTNLDIVSHDFPLIHALQTYTVTLTAANVCNSFSPIQKPVAVPAWYGVYLPLVLKSS